MTSSEYSNGLGMHIYLKICFCCNKVSNIYKFTTYIVGCWICFSFIWCYSEHGSKVPTFYYYCYHFCLFSLIPKYPDVASSSFFKLEEITISIVSLQLSIRALRQRVVSRVHLLCQSNLDLHLAPATIASSDAQKHAQAQMSLERLEP